MRQLALFFLLTLSSIARAAPVEWQTVDDFVSIAGKPITAITINVVPIFENDGGGFYRVANQLKAATRSEVVERELLFKIGDQVEPLRLAESIRNLRTLGFLRRVKITPVQDGDGVALTVTVQDTWTLLPQFSFSSVGGRDRMSAGVIDSNVVGAGKRVELQYDEEDNRRGFEAVFDDRRLWGTDTQLVTGIFDRNDGERLVLFTGSPFRSIVDRSAWELNADVSESIGRLFRNGDERQIFGQELLDVSGKYSFASGDLTTSAYRYSFGFRAMNDKFREADEKDYDDLSLDPTDVPERDNPVPDDRRYIGPTFSFEKIAPRFIPLAYIDRFERIEDYNLGDEYSITAHLAPTFLGSDDAAILLSGNRSYGVQLSEKAYLRGEVGGSTRVEESIENSLARFQIQYYHLTGPQFLGKAPVGIHTLVGSIFLDLGDDLDRDREFLVGGDNVIRGYKARTFTGDKRLGINLENRMHFIDNWYQLVSVGGAAFFDAGAATTDSVSDLFRGDLYSDVGFGLRFAFPRSTGGRVIRMDVAFPLRDGPGGSEAWEPRFTIGGGQLFSSQLRSEAVGSEDANVSVGFDRW